MEMSKVNSELDVNIKALTDRLTQFQEHLNSKILPNIKQLRKDRDVLIKDIATLNGAIQAYQGCKTMVSEPINSEFKQLSEEQSAA